MLRSANNRVMSTVRNETAMASEQKMSSESLWVYQLVDCYEDEQCLWDSNSKGYRNRTKRRDALQRIADMVDKDVEFVKSKIENLRSYYNKELAKLREARTNGAEPYLSKWVHFETMDSFLRNQVLARKVTSSVDGEEAPLDEMSSDTNEANDTPCTHDANDPLQCDANHEQAPVLRNKTRNKRQSDSDLYQESTKVLKIASALLSATSTNAKHTHDEFDIFGQHVANEMRLITDFKSRQHAKLKIQAILFDAQFSEN